MHQHSELTDEGMIRIGNGVGPLGRWFRLLIGLNIALHISLGPLFVNPLPSEQLWSHYGEIGLWFLVIVGAYLVTFHVFGRLFFVRLSPWAGTAIFLGVPTVLRAMGWLPMEFQIAFGFYVGISLVATFFMRYGGCEVVAFPSIFFKQRYTMYCPYNAIDAIERAVAIDHLGAFHRLLAVVSLGIFVTVGGYMIIFEMHAFFSRWGIGFTLPSEIAWALVVPVLHLSFLTYRAYRIERRLLAPPVRKFGLGAAILALLALGWVWEPFSHFPSWRVVMALGAAYFLYQLVLVGLGRARGASVAEAASADSQS